MNTKKILIAMALLASAGVSVAQSDIGASSKPSVSATVLPVSGDSSVSFPVSLAAAENTGVNVSASAQSGERGPAKPLSKSEKTRQGILKKVANHEPIDYIEKLYLR